MLSQLFEQKGMYYSTRKSHFPSIVLASFMNVCNCVKYLFASIILASFMNVCNCVKYLFAQHRLSIVRASFGHHSGIIVKMRIFIQVEGNGDCMFLSLVKQMIF